MIVVRGAPPNFADIVAVFGQPALDRRALFAWGDRIYSPGGLIELPEPLLKHEGVHGARQTATESAIRAWWDKYLSERQFRFDEELLAHRAEWQALDVYGRPERRRIQHAIVKRFASKLYALGVTEAETKRLLKAA